MKNKNILVFLLLIIIGIFGAIAYLPKVYAKENNGRQIQQKMQTQLLSESKEDNDQFRYRLNIRNEEFVIYGVIKNILDKSIIINSQQIIMDSQITGLIQINGRMASGEKVKINGIVHNGIYYAKKIVVIGTGQGKDKSEIKDNDELEEEDNDVEEISPNFSPKPSLDPIILASPTPLPIYTPAPSPTPSASIAPPSISSQIGLSQLLLEPDSISKISMDNKVTLLEDMGIELDKLWEKILNYLYNLVR